MAEKAREIVHIPEILYQWRLHGDSSGTRQQSEVMGTSRNILERHLARCGEEGTVYDGSRFNLFEVCYPLRAGLKVAIVIPTKNHGDLVRQCITSLRATVREVEHDIIIIDHESDEPETVAYLASLPSDVRVLRYTGPFNFSAINNWAVARLAGGYSHYLFCNNDIEAMRPGWLEKMLELGQKPDVGIVGAKLLYPDRKSIQHAGVCVGAYGAAEHYGKRLRYPEDRIEPGYAEMLFVNHELSAVTAACMLMSREAFEAVSGFDEAIAVGFGDVDLCLRVGKAGFRILFCPHAELVHYESFTRGTSTEAYHSPGLALNRTDWAVRDPLACNFEIRRRIVARDAATGLEQKSFSGSGTKA